MALNYSVGGGGGDFKRVPAGTHLGICTMVADIGLQPGSAMYPDPKRQVVIRWEVPGERVEYEKDGQKVEGPLTISRTLTASMNEKAGLRKLLESWRGKKFTDAEAAKFDVSSILGKPCLLNVTETEKNGETYSNVAGVSPLIKGMTAPAAENPLVMFDPDSATQADFDALPKWIKEKVANAIQPKTQTQVDESRAEEFAEEGDFVPGF